MQASRGRASRAVPLSPRRRRGPRFVKGSHRGLQLIERRLSGDASTGEVARTTPAGRFAVYDENDGYDPGPLGVLYRAKYFIRGVAEHGYPTVPATPASHGWVRVTNAAMTDCGPAASW